MDKDASNGMMEENMKEIISMITKMDMVSISGKMIKNMKDFGRMINGMVMEYSPKIIKSLKVNGIKVNWKLINELINIQIFYPILNIKNLKI